MGASENVFQFAQRTSCNIGFLCTLYVNVFEHAMSHMCVFAFLHGNPAV